MKYDKQQDTALIADVYDDSTTSQAIPEDTSTQAMIT
jgi:hypothetical protein